MTRQVRAVRARALALALAVGVAAPACAADGPSVIRIGVATAGVGGRPFCALSYVCVAHVQGLLEKAFAADGTKIEWHFYSGAGPAVNEAFAGGQLDFAWEGDLAAIVGRAIGLKTHLLMAAGGRWDYFIAVPADSPAKNLADLRGKTLALFKGTNVQTVGIRILESEGLTTSDLDVVNLDPATSLAALASHQVDAALVSFWGYGLRDQGKIRFIYSTADHSPKLSPEAALLVTDTFRSRYPETVQRVVDACLQAARWSSEEANRPAVEQIFAKTAYPLSFFQHAYAGYQMKQQADPNFDAFVTRQFKDVAAISLRLGLIRRQVDVDEWIDRGPLLHAMAAQNLQHYWPAYADDGKTVVGE